MNIARAAFMMVACFSAVAQARIDRFFMVSPQVYRGGQPTEMNDYEVLQKLGIKTMVNLRYDGFAEEAIANSYGFAWRMFPMRGMQTPTDEVVNAALAVIDDPASQPVFVHCIKGKDRTGVIIALRRVLHDKWSPQKAYAE